MQHGVPVAPLTRGAQRRGPGERRAAPPLDDDHADAEGVGAAAAALRASDRLVVQLRLAALFGAIAGIGGMELSYVADVAAGPSVALVACALAVVASLAPGRGAARTGRGPIEGLAGGR